MHYKENPVVRRRRNWAKCLRQSGIHLFLHSQWTNFPVRWQ